MSTPGSIFRTSAAVIFCASAACSSIRPSAPPAPADPPLPTVGVCQVLRTREAYDGKRLRLAATFAVGGGIGPAVLDTACLGGARTWVDFMPASSSCTSAKLQKRLERMKKRSGFRWAEGHATQVEPVIQAARVVLVGRFVASNPVRRAHLDSGSPPAGEVGGSKTLFEHVLEVECIEDLGRPQARLP